MTSVETTSPVRAPELGCGAVGRSEQAETDARINAVATVVAMRLRWGIVLGMSNLSTSKPYK
jgi:hypothetical protein